MKEKLMREKWERLQTEERRALLEQMAKQYGLELLGEETFRKWGRETRTGCFTGRGGEFVFVPGDTVTLGWQEFAQGMDQATREEFQEEMENIGWEGTLTELLQEQMDPVHRAVIGPMLVERTLQTVGYEEVSLDDPRLTGNEDWMAEFQKAQRGECSQYTIAEFQKAQRGECSQYTISEKVRFTRTGDGWRAGLYHQDSFSRLREALAETGFSLPTADEWAYLCGGGCRTLYPWGDSFDYEMGLPYLEPEERAAVSCDLRTPNFFGLTIACDPYRDELTVGEDGALVIKGGDGGCNLCGGADAAVGFLPCAPYFRQDRDDPEEELDGEFDFYRRVIRVELE
ncbi:MAG: hypothetical protein HFF13_06005 [Angelakisella sp.]|jgi:hypothetical protein|nr:hypothetical protein [Angelakisella sp.]